MVVLCDIAVAVVHSVVVHSFAVEVDPHNAVEVDHLEEDPHNVEVEGHLEEVHNVEAVGHLAVVHSVAVHNFAADACHSVVAHHIEDSYLEENGLAVVQSPLCRMKAESVLLCRWTS